MAFLGTSELQSLLPLCIDKYDSKRINEVAYELGLGNEVYLTDSESGKKEILDDKNSQVVIKPGQFALLLTEEIVTIPKYIIAFISIKFSQKIKGLINVSGFHVDPGFKGKIIFSVYNAGPATIVLDKGSPYFMIWFSKLTSDSSEYDGDHKNQEHITAENISALKGELASPNALLERMKGNESRLTNFSWAAGILLTIGIGLSMKSCSDTSKFNEGYNAGMKEKTANQYISDAISDFKIDSIVNYKIDSILKSKQNTDNDKTNKR